MGEAVMDVAMWIFEDICHYIAARSARSIPFPQMVTQLCLDQGVTSDEPYTHGEGGVTPAVSSVGTRARAEAAKSTQVSGGLKAKGVSASKKFKPTPAPPRTSSLQEMVATMHASINRILRRQEIQWEIQMNQHAWSHSIYEKFGIEPMIPIPAEYMAEFAQSVPREPPATPSTPVTPATTRPSASSKSSAREEAAEEEEIEGEEEETEPEDFFDI